MEVCGVGAMHCLTARCPGGGTTLDLFLELESRVLAPGRDWGARAMGSKIRSREPGVQAPGRDWVMGNEGARS